MACKLNRTTNNFGAVNERLGGLIISPNKRKSLATGFPFPTVTSPVTAQTSKRQNSPVRLDESSIDRVSGIKSTPGSRQASPRSPGSR